VPKFQGAEGRDVYPKRATRANASGGWRRRGRRL